MIGYLDLEDADGNAVRFHPTDKRRLSNAAGLPGVLGAPGARDATYNRPAYHGSVTRSRWQKAGLVTLEGVIVADSADDAIAEYDALIAPLFDALDTGRLMTWQRGTDGDGVELQAVARLTGDDISVTSDAGGRILRYQAHLRLDDPRGYTQALTTATGGTLNSVGGDLFTGGDLFATSGDLFNQSAGATAAVNNTGTRPTPPMFRVYGYATSAQVLLVGTDQRIALTGTIAPGDFVEIDVAERTLKLNGTSPAQYLIDAATTTWFELPRGTSTVRLLAGSNDSVTRVDVLFRPAYA